jgi:hypothetical protein
MRKIQRLDGLQRQLQRALRRAARPLAQIVPHLPERPQHPRAIESLPLTMIAITHLGQILC